MKQYRLFDETIAAISTPRGLGGIGIIKVSGLNAISVVKQIFMPLQSDTETAPRRLCYGHIFDPETGDIIDEALVAFMPAPKTYTGENISEIQAHAGAIVLEKILELVLRYDVRLAEPGEFTKRAFLNGKIDLTKAEALFDLIHAKTEKAAAFAARNLAGSSRRFVESTVERLMDLLVEVEAAMDFPDEMDTSLLVEDLLECLESEIKPGIMKALSGFNESMLLKDGVRVAIAGAPNAGKSSLMNSLLNDERVIVTGRPGTTRDVVRETIEIEGVPVLLSDTAGIQRSQDPAEMAGIEMARKELLQSDIILFLHDVTKPFPSRAYEEILSGLEEKVFLVFNKIDIRQKKDPGQLGAFFKDTPLLFCSAKTGEGVDGLKKALAKRLSASHPENEYSGIVSNLRQKKCLEEGLRLIDSAVNALHKKNPLDIVAIDIRDAVARIRDMTGGQMGEDVLEGIFGRFCVGK